MDFKRRLVGYLGALLLALLLVSVLINLVSLRDDVNAEVIASERQVQVMRDTSGIKPGPPLAKLARRLAGCKKTSAARWRWRCMTNWDKR
jgi:two-component system sensor histidine kinase UhpB